MATNRTWRDDSGEQHESATYHRVVVWGKRAKAPAEYLRKGAAVYVDGTLERQSYRKPGEDSDRYTWQIVAWQVGFLDSPTRASSPPEPTAPTSAPAWGERGDDDIPF